MKFLAVDRVRFSSPVRIDITVDRLSKITKFSIKHSTHYNRARKATDLSRENTRTRHEWRSVFSNRLSSRTGSYSIVGNKYAIDNRRSRGKISVRHLNRYTFDTQSRRNFCGRQWRFERTFPDDVRAIWKICTISSDSWWGARCTVTRVCVLWNTSFYVCQRKERFVPAAQSPRLTLNLTRRSWTITKTRWKIPKKKIHLLKLLTFRFSTRTIFIFYKKPVTKSNTTRTKRT